MSVPVQARRQRVPIWDCIRDIVQWRIREGLADDVDLNRIADADAMRASFGLRLRVAVLLC